MSDPNIFFRYSLHMKTPSEKQLDELEDIISVEGNQCNFLSLDGYFINMDPESEDNKEIYIVYSNSIYSDDTGEHLPLGVFILGFVDNDIFYDKIGKSYTVVYVDGRCSLTNFPYFKKKIEEAFPGTEKPGMGGFLEFFINDIAKAHAKRRNTMYTIIFNYSMSDAVDYHLRNGWKPYAQKVLVQIKNNKKKTANEEFIDNDMVIEDLDEPQWMYKIIPNNA